MQPLFTVVMKVVKALEECHISYLIGGSLGSSIHGIPRATLDADLVSDIKKDQIGALVEKLQGEFLIDPDMIKEAIQNHGCFNLIHLETMFKIDVFVLKDTPYEITEFSRRRSETMPGISEKVQIATPEDIILNKLIWYKAGGGVSERQWEDAKGVFKVQGGLLDLQYIQDWAKILKIEDLLIDMQKEFEK
ncbi:MAG: hypothetical protein EHM45_21750 [Desulfobacteraceae bacterium]|nr:MAG: hypothetical protein EHM45_21750 [Desulfobacteraceae bacterium]